MAYNPPTTSATVSSSSYTYAAATTPYFPTPFHLQQTPPPPPVAYIGAAPPPAATTAYTLPQYQQAQQLFQRDAQTITPEALEGVKAALASSDIEHKAETKKKAIPRKAAGQAWEDPTLAEWPENDFRLFCGDLGNEVNDDVLSKAFARFPHFNMARVVRDKRTGKTKGYGFVSFSNPADLVGALKEMNGKYVGNRPIKLRKSTWTERTDKEALQRQKVAEDATPSSATILLGIIPTRKRSYRRKACCTNESRCLRVSVEPESNTAWHPENRKI
ncbi:hypothetical protein CASFOL_021784 [Castilleja foliolosa]|uniref:RRM domain-containing protein n=1 Tax=Castilleja foliolosa TaxID=1961234 RepID=A0ABD3CXJ8_9LAMI